MEMSILWLVPIAYAVHILEEAPRFVSWTRNYPKLFSHSFSTRYFITGNCVFMAYVLISVGLAVSVPAPWALTLGLSAAAWIFANSWIHIITTLSSGIYSPGLVSGSALYLPLSLVIYAAFLRAGQLTWPVAIWSAVIGFAVMYLPMLASGRLDRIEGKKKAPQG